MYQTGHKKLWSFGNTGIKLFNIDNSEDMIRFSYVRQGPWRVFGKFSYEEFMKYAQKLAKITEKFHGSMTKKVFGFTDYLDCAEAHFLSSGCGQTSYSGNDTRAALDRLDEVCDKRVRIPLEEFSHSQYNELIDPSFFLNTPKENNSLMVCLSTENNKRRIEFYGQCLTSDSFVAIAKEFHKPGVTYWLGDGYEDLREGIPSLQNLFLF